MQAFDVVSRQGLAAADGAIRGMSRKPSPVYFAAIFGWSMSAVSAAMCAVVRMPLGTPHWVVFVKAFLLLGASISCAAVLCVWRIEKRGRSYAAVLAATLAVIFSPCLAWLMGPAADIVVYPVLLGLLVVGIGQAVAAARRMPGSHSILAIMCGCLAGFGYFLLINSRGYATVFTPELALVGTQHLDTLFHASIANMLVKHHALSTGLDGLVPIKYHVLSHIWLGCLGLWLGVTTLESYYIGAQIVAIPMLLFSLSLATYLLRRPGAVLIDGALITLLPLLLLLMTEIWGWTSYLVSESYFFAMILFLLALPLLAEMAESPRRHRLDAQLAALGVAGILILLSKISVGVIFWAAAGFLLWRQFGMTLLNLVMLAPSILLLVVFCAALSSPDSGTYVHAFALFSFIREFPQGAWPNVVANLLLLYAAWRVWRSGTSADRHIAEAFAVIAVSSLAPALLLQIGGGSAYYFANVGTWAAIVFCTAYAGNLLTKQGQRLLKPRLVLGAIVLLTFATDEKRNSAAKLGMQFSELQARVRLLAGKGPGEETTTRQRIAAVLLSTGLMHDSAAVVFVPPKNTAFWTNYPDCRGDPFFVPAIFGAPMLKGLNPSALKCPRDPYYGFAAYAADANSRASTDLELCARAADLGFDTVFVLPTPTVSRKIKCGNIESDSR